MPEVVVVMPNERSIN
jgi:hypothetical protein